MRIMGARVLGCPPLVRSECLLRLLHRANLPQYYPNLAMTANCMMSCSGVRRVALPGLASIFRQRSGDVRGATTVVRGSTCTSVEAVSE